MYRTWFKGKCHDVFSVLFLLEISAAFHESLLTELLFLKFNSHIVTSESLL